MWVCAKKQLCLPTPNRQLILLIINAIIVLHCAKLYFFLIFLHLYTKEGHHENTVCSIISLFCLK